MFEQKEVYHLVRAVRGNELAVCQEIVLKCGKDVITAPDTRISWNVTALHDTVQFNRLEILQYFLQQHINCDVRDIYGNTPLVLAAFLGFTECVRLLLLYGAVASLRVKVIGFFCGVMLYFLFATLFRTLCTCSAEGTSSSGF
eukprot:m.261803 g.261803  ORF g.261803 m.261803 type:complete len:143 (-) comp54616_c0_seq31:353-781(-)